MIKLTPIQVKVIEYFVAILILCGLIFVIKYQRNIIEQNKAMQTSVVAMKQLQDQIVRSQSEYVNKSDLAAFAKSNGVDLSPIQSDLKTLGAKIDGISVSKVSTPGIIATNVKTTSTTPRDNPVPIETVSCKDGSTVKCPDTFGYIGNQQNLKLNEPFGNNIEVPVGNVSFSAWKAAPWDYTIAPRDYSAITVIGVNNDGSRHFIDNKLNINTGGKTYSVPIAHSEYQEILPLSSFSFNPRLYMGLGGGFSLPFKGEFAPDLELSLFSYGQLKLSPTWTFLGLGIAFGMERATTDFILTPVGYNIRFIPFSDSLYIAPSIMCDGHGNISILGGIQVGL